jgi:hypothetical protein
VYPGAIVPLVSAVRDLAAAVSSLAVHLDEEGADDLSETVRDYVKKARDAIRPLGDPRQPAEFPSVEPAPTAERVEHVGLGAAQIGESMVFLTYHKAVLDRVCEDYRDALLRLLDAIKAIVAAQPQRRDQIPHELREAIHAAEAMADGWAVPRSLTGRAKLSNEGEGG